MRIATWNIERLKHIAEADKIYYLLDKVRADILVLTETDTRIFPKFNYCFRTESLAGIQSIVYANTENRVSIYTNYPCIKRLDTYDSHTAICIELETEYGSLCVYGTIIGVFGNREKSFQGDLINQMKDIEEISSLVDKNVCMIGDYNLSFGDNYYYTVFGRHKVNDTFKNCEINLLTRNRLECIDHIAISEPFIKGKEICIDEWNQDKKLSDHKGIVVEIR